MSVSLLAHDNAIKTGLLNAPYAIRNYDMTTKTRRHSIERDLVSVTASEEGTFCRCCHSTCRRHIIQILYTCMMSLLASMRS